MAARDHCQLPNLFGKKQAGDCVANAADCEERAKFETGGPVKDSFRDGILSSFMDLIRSNALISYIERRDLSGFVDSFGGFLHKPRIHFLNSAMI